MTKQELFDLFKIEDLRDLPDAVEKVIFSDLPERDKVYHKLIELNNGDMSKDWFQELYESELSERKQKKQDFTPHELGIICSELVGGFIGGTTHEPTAGNGSMIIADWWNKCKKVLPWEFIPSENMVTCWELSPRSIPILLLNLSIRGMMGYVYHGDVLENTIRQKYILLNRKDDALGFSEIIKADKNQKIVREIK